MHNTVLYKQSHLHNLGKSVIVLKYTKILSLPNYPNGLMQSPLGIFLNHLHYQYIDHQ